jgi:hypothetical protein
MTAFEAIFFVAGFVFGGLVVGWCYEGLVKEIRENVEERWRAAINPETSYKGRR